jgi:glycosyltransferase 2 family protein
LRALCAVGLILVLVRLVDWQSAVQHFYALEWSIAVFALAGLCLQFVTSAWKWRHAMRIHGLTFDLWPLTRIYATGLFFNYFLPSTIGGDAYRAISTLPSDGVRSRAVSAVLIERVVGFAALLALGCAGALAEFERSSLARAFLAVAAIAAVVGCAVLAFLWARPFEPLSPRWRSSKVAQALGQNVTLLRTAGSKWFTLIGSSLVFQVIAIAIIYLLFRSLDTEVSWSACALIAALAGLASVVPISINGIGVVEGAFAGTAVALGVDYEPALAVALLIRVLVLPISIVFGLWYVWRGEQPREPNGPTHQSAS